MRLSLDYDETYTRDPAMWAEVVRVMQRCGHEVVCVTMRRQREAADMTPLPEGVTVYFTGRRAKGPWCDARGLRVDVWIDDSPHWITRDG